MVAVRQSPFGGMVPAVDDRLLPNVNGALSQDTWLYSGTAVGLPQPKLLYTLVDPTVGKIYRLPIDYTDALHLANSKWMEFISADTDVVRSQVINDTYDRFYWCSPYTATASPSGPRYATHDMILADINNVPTHPAIPNAYLLGIPQPGAPTGVVSGGVSATLKSVAYVHTWVSAYGEEGPPSTPLFLSAIKIDATVTLTLQPADPLDTGGELGDQRNLTKSRIYRTVVGTDGTTTFFFVGEVPIATLTFVDNAAVNTDQVVALNAILSSTTWTGPPVDLIGWVSLSNGMVVGFRKNELWFCEPFRMHAWPVQYTLVTEYPIIGLGVANQTLIVCTEGFVYTATGINPGSMQMTKLPGLFPCTSRGSIVSTAMGVYFSAPQGLVLVGPGGLAVATKELIRKDEWNELVPTTTFRGAGLGAAYFGFGQARLGVFEKTAFDTASFTQEDLGDGRRGILIDPTSLSVAFNLLTSPIQPVANVINDAWSAETFIIRGGQVLWMDIGDVLQPRNSYKWRSKIFQSSFKKNFQAMKTYYNATPTWPIQYVQKACIPEMTGTVTSGVTITADSALPGFNPWRAASSLPGSAWSSQAAALPHMLVVNFGSVRKISSYQIAGPPSAVALLTSALKSWTLEGSNDGAIYTVLDARNSQPPWGSSEVRTYTIAYPVNYQYYRLNISDVQGAAPNNLTATVAGFQLNEPVVGIIRVYADDRLVMERSLVKSGEQWRMPSGFSADFWQWEIEASVEIFSMQAATSPKELQTV